MKRLAIFIASASLIFTACVHQEQQKYITTYPSAQVQQPAHTPSPPSAPKPTPKPAVKPTPKPTATPSSPQVKLQRPVLFGASWCTPCKQLHAKLDAQGKRAGEHYDYFDIDTQMDNFTPVDLRIKARTYIDAKGIPAAMDIYGNMSHGNSLL